MSAATLRKCDVVLTTYQVVAGELPGAGGAKAKVVNDESDSDDPGPDKKKRKGSAELFAVKWKVSSSSPCTDYTGLDIDMARLLIL